MMLEGKAIIQRGRPKKTWWHCVTHDMGILGLPKSVHSLRIKWRRINGESC